MKRENSQEDACIRAAQAGDPAAFEHLLQTHYDRLYRFACTWSGNPTDAEDITQQACIKLAHSLNQFRFDCAFTTWLYRIVVSCAIDWQRREQRHQHQDTSDLPEPAHRETPESGIFLQQLLQRIEGWGEGFKATLLLVFSEGMTHSEAANVLHVKESTISWRIHQIRQKLSLLAHQEEAKS
ncbi:RNA polymerase sigma factor [Teredinibacter turnerae]|uniref:RNA polymerase sigma factor n=1 Tax=Teredinibacter turnerae TaxID=2426 RepID=UPI00037B25C5|nr:RNA polymerase sigma factor [Teredinibacter turnerae]